MTGERRIAVGGALRPRARLRLILGMRLLERLESERPKVGHRLPSIRALAGAARVHRNTAAAVYSDLSALGLIRCMVGAGSYAASPPLVERDAVSLVCRDESLARWLQAATSGHRNIMSSGAGPSDGRLFLHPLHVTPVRGPPVHPLAPTGDTCAAIRSLRRGSSVAVVTECAAIRDLLGDSIRAAHGYAVRLVVVPGPLSPAWGSPPWLAADVVFHDPWTTLASPGAAQFPIRIASWQGRAHERAEPRAIGSRTG